MRRFIHSAVLIPLFLVSCTKTVEKIYYQTEGTGAVVGTVVQKTSNARVIVMQVGPVDSTVILADDGSFRIEGLHIGNYDLVVKAEGYGTRKITNVLIEAGGTTFVGEISLSKVPDQVVSFYPDDRTEIVFDPRWSRLSISVQFSRAMDRESLEAAFSTDPPSEGTFYWGNYEQLPTPRYFYGDALWENDPGGEITTYTHIKSFTYRMARKDCFTDTTYTVTLSTAAEDTAGKPLDFPLQFRFSTVQSSYTQNAILTVPEHGDIWVDPMENASVFMTFPRRMNQSSVEELLQMTPPTEVIPVWTEANVLRIYTGGPLRCNTTYRFYLPATATDLDGIELGEPFEFSFTTAPVGVEYTQPQKGQIFVSRTSHINIRFNTYMMLSAAERAFQITPATDGRVIRGYENNDTARDVITFIPSTSLRYNTKYTVILGTEAYDLHGTHLDEPYEFSFVTEPE
jgi:hypothetical protein